VPDLFSFNPWALNPWATEPARDAVQAPSLRDVLVPAEPLVVRTQSPPTTPSTSLPEITYETDDWFQSLRQNWETKAPVIAPQYHVNKNMRGEVAKFVNRHLKQGETPRTELQCFDFAAYQMHVANGPDATGFRTGGRPSADERSFQMLIEYPENGKLVEEVQLDVSIEAILYIKEALHQDMPVLTGLCIRTFFHDDGRPARPNNVKSTWFVEPTNHYVVIVGMGATNYGHPYFQYYDYYFDPLGEGQHCKFYLRPTMKLEAGEKMVVAEVRRTSRR
jgi:hypothetical protein